MGFFNSKHQEDDNCLCIEDLPVEIMCQIFGYFDTNEKMKIAMVNKRWFGIAIIDIKTLSIKWPGPKMSRSKLYNFFSALLSQEKSQDFRNLVGRFRRLKNLELTIKITNKDMIGPLNTFEFDGTLEFEISPDLIPTKNPRKDYGHSFTLSRRIKINPSEEKDFDLVYDRNQIISFEICVKFPCQDDEIDSVVEEILSLDNVSEIIYRSHSCGCYDKIIRNILTRPYLKQIIFDGRFDILRFDTEEEFPINCYVEEIEFDLHFLIAVKLRDKLFDALPNIKKVKIIVSLSSENQFKILLDYIKTISKLQHLKSLNVKICSRYDEPFDAKRFGNFPEMICEINFPMKSEVVIANFPRCISIGQPHYLTNLVEKKEGEDPKIVNCQ